MKKLWLIFYLLPSLFIQAQPKNGIVSGPMLGQTELRTASIWVEVTPRVKSVAVQYWKAGQPMGKQVHAYSGVLGNEFNPLRIDIGGLDFNQKYEYDIIINGKPASAGGMFTTKDLWQWRKPAPDFSFLTGSCAYFNDPKYDRPGKPYGADSSIFETMAKDAAAFMVWLGDNWYTREVDILSTWGLYYRASHDRSLPILQPFWKSMPHYAIWDDHDYGPDDADGSYELKDSSRALFLKYWANPSYGQNQEGIYTKISYSDVDVFLTDDRYFRSANEMADSVGNKPNPEKHFLGKKQMEWLKNALLFSHASFKVIAIGSQVLNPYNLSFECMHHYPAEYEELLRFLDEQHIQGVLFLTGDRHHSEVIKLPRANNYTLYDITSSPITSGVSKVSGIEIENPWRVPGTLVETQNYSKFSISGRKNERKLTVSFIDKTGKQLANWSVSETELTK